MELLTEPGVSLLQDKAIAEEFTEFYKQLFFKKEGDRHLPFPINWAPMPFDQSSHLEELFTEDDIWNAVKALGFNQSSGHEGFTIKFFKN